MDSNYEKLGAFYLGREVDAAGKVATTPFLYESRDLTTHAVCVGMTGSGKTGLCLSIIEEAAIDGIPAICIDPKGDIGNLMLTFPSLAAADFAPWIDPADAARKQLSVDALAAQTADTWKKGLADWDQSPQRVTRLRDAVDVTIYTPGGSAGQGLSILRTLSAPPAETLADPATMREQIGTTVAALLALLGRDADPVKSRDYILLARILESAWTAGHALDLAAIIQQIQKPGFDKLGAFDLETFYPAKQRLELAMAVNALLASPGFAAWLEGEPLDAQRLLFTPEGKPRIAIISIAHLSDAERMFIVTLILNELVAWMRRQSGTGSLRALFYMDEIFGYFPPTAIPPSKPPMLTLLKQARAFGLGCLLATQNPVDLDYRGLGNAGTWFIGRLQTDRDRQRVIEGLTSAAAGTGLERGQLDALLAQVAPRVFLMRNAHDDAAHLLKTRWTLSYLRGPLTSPEISRLMQPRQRASTTGTAVSGTAAAATLANALGNAANSSDNAKAASAANAGAAELAGSRPPLGAQVRELFLTATRGGGASEYRPMALGAAKLHFVDGKLGIDTWQTLQLLAPFSDDGRGVLWDQAIDATAARDAATAAPDAHASFADLPAAAARADSYAAWGKSLAAQLYETAKTQLFSCDALKLVSNAGESEGDFCARLSLAARERRDAAIDKLRAGYAPKVTALTDRIARAQSTAAVQHSQVTQQTLQTVVSVGATVLGALFGRRAISSTSISKAATAMRSASRIGEEHQESVRAADNVASLQQQLQQLNTQCEADIARLTSQYDPAALTVVTQQISARKSDIAVGDVVLAWVPWRRGTDGFPARAV